jgi:hypothetical protein
MFAGRREEFKEGIVKVVELYCSSPSVARCVLRNKIMDGQQVTSNETGSNFRPSGKGSSRQSMVVDLTLYRQRKGMVSRAAYESMKWYE